MDTSVSTPQDIFLQPQRLVVPLFQRPYVWNAELQWEPLWMDVQYQAIRFLNDGHQNSLPHFLGSVVIQQTQGGFGGLQEWTVIDGQQRLTTLQILFDAASDIFERLGLQAEARQVRDTIENGEAYRKHPEDRYKVWPTNHDRPAFAEVMSAESPIEYSKLKHRKSRLVEAHRFFHEAILEYLADGDEMRRAEALAHALLHGLKFAVIQLGPDENAQEIFETLNARGTPLTPADLIKNLVFQRIAASGDDTDRAYLDYWSSFDNPFWEEIVAKGRIQHSRLSLFFNHWLIAETGEQVLEHEVFRSFKRYLDAGERQPATLLGDIGTQAGAYRRIIEQAEGVGQLDDVSRFAYRMQALDQGVVSPVLLWLIDPLAEAVPEAQLGRALQSLESWVVRRVLTRKTTKRYNQILRDLLRHLQDTPREEAGDTVERFLRSLQNDTDYWPADTEVKELLQTIAAYHSYPRARLRVVLEALEDHLRGIGTSSATRAEQQAPRNYSIEHVMPQDWRANWPLGSEPAEVREVLVQTLGNLTLLPRRFNSSVSNAGWEGERGKRVELRQHSELKLNVAIADRDAWDETAIRERTDWMVKSILTIWPVPTGHVGAVIGRRTTRGGITVADLIAAGLLSVGQQLRLREGPSGSTAKIAADGRLMVNGKLFRGAASAARAYGRRGGRDAWIIDDGTDTTLADCFAEFAARTGADMSLSEGDDESDE